MNYNPSNNGYVEGRLLSLRLVDNAAGDKSVFMRLSVEDNFKSADGAYVRDGETVKGYARRIIDFQDYIRRSAGTLGVYEYLRKPGDGSASSCDKGALVGVSYHLTTRDSSIPVTNSQGEVYQRADGSVVNHTFLVASVDSVHLRESVRQRDARREAQAQASPSAQNGSFPSSAAS